MTKLYDWEVDDDRVAKIRDTHRSVSQVKSYKACGHQYFLERVVKAWQKPAAWFPHGTAVHKAAEVWELSGRTMSTGDVLRAFATEYDEEANRYAEETPNWDYWHRSGRWRGDEDLARRYEIGLTQVHGYLSYYQDMHPEEVIWITPDGKPAIELEFNIDLDGVKMKGYIDQAVLVREPVDRPRTASGAVSKSKAAQAEYEAMLAEAKMNPRTRDIKTGLKPGDEFQLATYDVAIEEDYGQAFGEGDYWMAKQGKPTQTYDLTGWPRERITEIVHEADAGIKALSFEPKPGEQCDRCSVAYACPFRA